MLLLLSVFLVASVLAKSSGLQPYCLMPMTFSVPSQTETLSTDLVISLFNDTECKTGLQYQPFQVTRIMHAVTPFASVILTRPLTPGEYIYFATNGTSVGPYYVTESTGPWGSNLMIGKLPWACATPVASISYSDLPSFVNGTCLELGKFTNSTASLTGLGLFQEDGDPALAN